MRCRLPVRPQDSSRDWFTDLWDFGRVVQVSNPGNQSVRGTHARIGVSGHALTGAWITLVIVIVALGLWRAWRAERAGHPLLAAAIVRAGLGLCVPGFVEASRFLAARRRHRHADDREPMASRLADDRGGRHTRAATVRTDGVPKQACPLRLLGGIVSTQALLAVAWRVSYHSTRSAGTMTTRQSRTSRIHHSSNRKVHGSRRLPASKGSDPKPCTTFNAPFRETSRGGFQGVAGR